MATCLRGGFGRLMSLVLAAVIGSAGPAAAQLPQSTTREQVDVEERLPTTGPAPRLSEAPVISEAPGEAPAAAQAETFSFRLNGINVTNATVYDAEAFAPLYESFVGMDVTLGNLREIADRIERMYTDGGYVATRAIIPPQAISDGVPTIEVYEGTIILYEINGEIGPVKKQIARLLDNLVTGRPARWSELERYLLLARDLPGISLTGTLRSAGDTAPGGIILVVDTARKAVDGFVNLQNLNSESAGRLTLSGGVAFNSNTRFGERLGAVALNTILQPLEQISGYLTYEQSLGSDGLVLRASGTRTYSEPGAELEVAEIVTNNTLINFHLEYPLVRSRDFSLWSRGGFEYIDQNSEAGENEIFDDQLRVLFAGLKGVWRPWGGGLTQFDLEVRQGLKTYGASTKTGVGRSRPDAVADFTIVRGEAEHYQPLGDFWAIDIRAVAQHSTKPTSSFEEMALGELTIGRGFEPGQVTGETGWGIAAEARFSTPDFVNATTGKYIDRVELFAFYDYARVYDKNSPFGTKFEDVASVGFGVRIQALETLFAEFYYASPLQKGLSVEEARPKDSIHFNITKFF